MYGETTPGVSAGSNSVGAREKWRAKVTWTSGAAKATAGTTNTSASAMTMRRVRRVIRTSAMPSSRIEDDFQWIADSLLEHVDRLVHAAERELVGDERLRREPSGREQRQRAADARAALATLGVDRDVPPHRVADVGSDRTMIEGDEEHLAAGLRHPERLIEGLVSACAVDDQVRALSRGGVHHRGHRIGFTTIDRDIRAELAADPQARLAR